ncbi:MAG: hypothetical protein LBJ14_08635 [Desulfarculales bacterium]|jgi:hypothetical protein|nr:hypothetical protein [Desulfarculales bacterium]
MKIPPPPPPEACRDTALALTFLLLLLWFFTEKIYFVHGGMTVLLGAMIWPNLFRPLTRIWLGFSLTLGKFMSKIVMAIIYILVLCPVALVRSGLLKRDPLGLRQWRNGGASCFVIRNHLFAKDDLENPF